MENPTIEVNEFSKKWEVNGMDTGIVAQGVPHLKYDETTQTYHINGMDTKLNQNSIDKSASKGKLLHDNAGQIKINWSEENRPQITGVVDGVQQSIPLNQNYSVSSFPTTTYPFLADEEKGGANVVDPNTNYLRELLAGQTMFIRIKIGYARKGANQQGAIILNISNPNPNSNFSENLAVPALRGKTSFETTVTIPVISDSVSLDPLFGYELKVLTEFSDSNLDVYISNIVTTYLATEPF